MNKSVNTKGIILKRINFKEADRILTIYTEELGKISAIAKGVRKMKSTRKGHLELFNLSELQLIESHKWYIVAQTNPLESFTNLKSDFNITNWGYYILETFEKTTTEQEPNKLLFKFLSKTIDFLDSSSSPHILNAYNLKLLRLNGFYSLSQHQIHSKELINYLKSLEKMKYEDVINIDASQETIKDAHLLLKNLTEEILEKNIKTQIIL